MTKEEIDLSQYECHSKDEWIALARKLFRQGIDIFKDDQKFKLSKSAFHVLLEHSYPFFGPYAKDIEILKELEPIIEVQGGFGRIQSGDLVQLL